MLSNSNTYFLKPIPKTALWGGFRLKKYLSEPAPFEKISELWYILDAEPGAEQAPFHGSAEPFTILLATEGEGFINGEPFKAGECCYMTGVFEVTGNIKFLEIKE